MAVSSKFELIFSSDGAWTHVKLKYNFEGVGSQGKLGEEYKDWLLKDAGLPLINAIRVKHVSMRYSRLRILLGTLVTIYCDAAAKFCNLSLILISFTPYNLRVFII